MTDGQLLNIWKVKTKRDKPGFKIEQMYLSYDECTQLQSGDHVDVRCCTGEIVKATITEIRPNDEVCVVYDDFKDTPSTLDRK